MPARNAASPDFCSLLRRIVTLIICVGVVVGHVTATETDADGRLYPSSANPLADVQQALDRADAYNIDMSTSVQYFEKWLEDDAVTDPVLESAELQQLYVQIDEFERQLADRLAAGYSVVGPMLEARVAGNSPDEFNASWNELEFPDYPPLSWESE